MASSRRASIIPDLIHVVSCHGPSALGYFFASHFSLAPHCVLNVSIAVMSSHQSFWVYPCGLFLFIQLGVDGHPQGVELKYFQSPNLPAWYLTPNIPNVFTPFPRHRHQRCLTDLWFNHCVGFLQMSSSNLNNSWTLYTPEGFSFIMSLFHPPSSLIKKIRGGGEERLMKWSVTSGSLLAHFPMTAS